MKRIYLLLIVAMLFVANCGQDVGTDPSGVTGGEDEYSQNQERSY